MSEIPIPKEIVLCPTCRKPIPFDAKKCTECDSYLDWRRFLGLGQTTLALLVALVSVISTALPQLYEWMSPVYSELHVETRQIYRQQLELFVSNAGNRNGRLIAVSLGATLDSGDEIGPLTLEVAHDGIVFPASSAVMHLTVHPEHVLAFLSWPFQDVEHCTLRARVAEYRKIPKWLDVECSRDHLLLFCRGTEGAARQAGLRSPDGGELTSACDFPSP